MNSLIGLKNSVMPSLAVPHAPAQNANPAPGKSSAGFTHGWFFFQQKTIGEFQQLEVFIDEKTWRIEFRKQDKGMGRVKKSTPSSVFTRFFSPETQKRTCLTILFGIQKNRPNHFP